LQHGRGKRPFKKKKKKQRDVVTRKPNHKEIRQMEGLARGGVLVVEMSPNKVMHRLDGGKLIEQLSGEK